ncbi:putative multidrug resistance protein fnx1 [Annulohypoxylon maeteangense]|uniref:putative multidrug resistance protein fnx1 n=1 Tax=Annulohypoxylon maeteangense TaxID=1927788 RepID=UPI002008DE14|nr:putative multidrug resistance protein fnx1 [Annulohypoxylon maeteangense]KAI0886605.1 putative multidrug resistance protein fnx1 [Annulohypoxylon maeteangense]
MEPESNEGLHGHAFDGISEPKSEVEQEELDLGIEQPKDGDRDIVYIQGPKFWLISAAVAIMMFMVNFEVPVVVTALVSITNDLGGFNNVSWVVSAYLLGYVAVIVIFAKFSDIFGRKPIFLLSILIFIIFSAACSASQTIVQLAVFRALQGVGGGGCWSLATIFVIELVPPEKYTKYISNISIVNALALLLGPIVGGAIASGTSWRWIFIINVPICVPAFIIAIVAIPNGFPYGDRPKYRREAVTSSPLGRIDILGTVLILLATLALTSGFEEADKDFPWRSGYVISLLTISGLLWIALVFWERHVTRANGAREPILPWRFLTNRHMMGVLLNLLFLGGPTIVSMFIIPQRFELVYNTSGLEAGVRLIPYTALLPIGSIIGSILAGKHIPLVYLLLFGSILQVIAFAVLGTLPSILTIPPRIYGLEVVAGLGCGSNFALLFTMIPFVIERFDNATGMGTGSQIRMMGSSIVLAIATSVSNTFLRPQLQALLGISDTNAISTLLPTLSPELQDQVRLVLAESYNREVLVLCVSAALQVPASLMMWRKTQLTI